MCKSLKVMAALEPYYFEPNEIQIPNPNDSSHFRGWNLSEWKNPMFTCYRWRKSELFGIVANEKNDIF